MTFESVSQFEALCRGFNEKTLTPRELIKFSECVLGIPCLGDASIKYGIAYLDGKRSFIFYNSCLPKILQSIVIAHEIGHHWLTHWNTHGVCHFNTSGLLARSGIESEASVFSLLAIIPNWVIEAEQVSGGMDHAGVVDLMFAWCQKNLRGMTDLDAGLWWDVCRARARVYCSRRRYLSRRFTYGP